MLTVYTISHLPYLLMLPSHSDSNTGGIGLLVYLVLLTEINDIAQYIVGKVLGHHPIIPKVSPGKTQEGTTRGVY